MIFDDPVLGGTVPISLDLWVTSWLRSTSNDIVCESDDVQVTWADWVASLDTAYENHSGLRAQRARLIAEAVDSFAKEACSLDKYVALCKEANLSEHEAMAVARESILGLEGDGTIGDSCVTWGDVYSRVVTPGGTRPLHSKPFVPEHDWVAVARRRLFGSDVSKLAPQDTFAAAAVSMDGKLVRQWLPTGPGKGAGPSIPMHDVAPSVPVLHGYVTSPQEALAVFKETVGHFGFVASIFRSRRFRGKVEVPVELVAYLQGVKMFRVMSANLLSELKSHCTRWFAENDLDKESHEWRTRVMRWAIIVSCLPNGDDENAMGLFESPDVYDFIQRSNEWLGGRWKDRRSWLLRQFSKFKALEGDMLAPTLWAGPAKNF